MKSLGLLRKAQLAFMTLLTMVITMACPRNAPRHEPDPLTSQEEEETNMDTSEYTEDSSQEVDNYPELYSTFFQKACQRFEKANNLSDIKNLLDDIGYDESKAYILDIKNPPADQNDFSALINANIDDRKDEYDRPISNKLNNTWSIFFKRDQEDKSWDERQLIGTECITIRCNTVLPNSENYSLIAFVICTQGVQERKSVLIPFVKSNERWYAYNNSNRTKTDYTPQEAMDLASQHGTIFFYKKMNK